MKGMFQWERLPQKAAELFQKYKYVLLVILAGVVILLLPRSGERDAEPQETAGTAAAAPEFDLEAMERVGTGKHIFTHIEWHMTAYSAQAEDLALPEGWVWVDRAALDREYAVPNAFQAFSEYVKGKLGYFS